MSEVIRMLVMHVSQISYIQKIISGTTTARCYIINKFKKRNERRKLKTKSIVHVRTYTDY